MLKILRVILPLLLATALIGGLVARSGLSWTEFVVTLRAVSPAAIIGILVCTALFLFVSAWKWRLVMSHVAVGEATVPAWDFSLYYTCFGAVLALVITPHAAMVVSRSVGMKLHSKGSAIASGAASAYEQLFDVVPLATMSLAALVSLVCRAGPVGWLLIAAALNGAAVLAMIVTLRSRFWSLARFIRLPRGRRAKLQEKLEWFATPAAKTLLGAPIVASLFAASLVRYVILLLRTGLVMASIGLPISSFRFVQAYGVARLSSLISITPGELGISEWTWTGVLAWMGFGLDDAARFVLVNRIYNIASLLILFGLVWLAFSGSLLFRADAVESQPIRRGR